MSPWLAAGASPGKFCNVNGGRATTNGQVLGGTAKNGRDFQDNDPVRVACAGLGIGPNGGEQVCGDAGQPPVAGTTGICLRARTACSSSGDCPAGDFCSRVGTLGALLTILLPESQDVPAAETYPSGLCTSGVFDAYPAVRSTYTGPCPSGGDSFGAKCFHGAIRNPDGSLNANCIVGLTSTRCPLLTPSGTDCRGANLWLRKPSGALVVDTGFPPARTNPAPPIGGRYHLGGYFRLHATSKLPGSAGFCTAVSNDEQVACLTGVASPCSIGYGSMRPVSSTGRGARRGRRPRRHRAHPEPGHRRAVQHPSGSNLDTYPFARPFYLGTPSASNMSPRRS